MNGYHGRVLEVNLRSGDVSEQRFDPQWARSYIGGVGFGLALLARANKVGVGATDPEAALVIASGPFTGTLVPGGDRCVVTAKSPLTGLYGDTDLGGWFGGKLKASGYDAVMIEGAAAEPVYMVLSNDGVELRPADRFWGMETAQAQEAILTELGAGPQASEREAPIVLAIGPAGEKLVPFACLEAQMRFFGGRLGMGAVLGSKNLKAIVATGKRRSPVADPEGLRQLLRELNRDLRSDGTCFTLSRYGTWNTAAPANLNGIMPVRNFQKTSFDRISQVDGDALLATIYDGKRTCPGCPIGCRRVVRGDDRYELSSDYGGIQYETLVALGPLLDNADPFAIAKAGERCNLLGLDTISTGVVIAFAMECYERGVIDDSAAGFPLRWGDASVILRLIEMIGRREGFGEVLAAGVRAAAKRIGGGSEAWAMHVKGLEIPMHDPRGKKGMGLAYATAIKGADHESSMHDEAFQRENAMPALGFTRPMARHDMAGKPKLVKTLQDYWGVLADCLPVCKFPLIPPRPFKPERVLAALNFVTGWDMTMEEYLECGERVFNLGRLLNLREGMSPSEDRLPDRFGEAVPEGGSAGQTLPGDLLASALQEYYTLRGWSEEGVPTPETRARLNLEWVDVPRQA